MEVATNGNDGAIDNFALYDATPYLTKSFATAVLPTGSDTRLTITVNNTPDLASKNGWQFIDALPAGLRVAVDPKYDTTCSSATATGTAAGSTSLTLGGNLTTGMASCTFSINVTSTTAGTYSNGAAQITTSTLDKPTTPATVTFTAPLTATKSFTPNPVRTGQVTTMTVRLTNPNNVPITGVSFTDSYPGGLVNDAVPTSSQCGGAVTGTRTGNTLSLAGGSLATNSSCTITAPVRATSTAASTDLTNTIVDLKGAEIAGTGAFSGTLQVRNPVLALTKTAAVTSMVPGVQTSYALTVTNSGPGASPSATVVDTLPSGLRYDGVNGPATCTQAGQTLTCTVTGPIAAAGGTASFTVLVTPLNTTSATTVTNKAAVDPTGGTAPVNPSTCTAAGNPAGCAISGPVPVAVSPTITLTKQIAGAGRIRPTDQFTVQIQRDNADVSTATTAGTNLTASTGAYTATAGVSYRLTESAANTTPATEVTQYTRTISCRDDANLQPGLSATNSTPVNLGPGYTIAPVSGAKIVCTITNSSAQPTIVVQKVFGSQGRGSGQAQNRQFDVKLFDDTVPIDLSTPLAQAWTSGTGSDLGDRAVTAPLEVRAGTRYRVIEQPRGNNPDFDRFKKTLTCTDRNGIQTDLPDNAELPTSTTAPAQSGLTFVPMPGTAISCTVANILETPTIIVTKEFGGAGRYEAGDQVTVQLRRGTVSGTVLTPAAGANPTTVGAGSSVTAGSGTTGVVKIRENNNDNIFYVTEVAAPGVDLTKYDKRITCTDAAALMQGLPNDAVFDPAAGVRIDVTGFAGAMLSCTITNSAPQPTISVSKALAGGGRVLNSDQFQVTLARDDVGLSPQPSWTTTGSGVTVTPGTGTTGVITGVAGSRYTVNEAAAGGTDIGRYAKSVQCTDSTGRTQNLPNGTLNLAGGASFTPPPGANVSCTITNSTALPTITLTKQIAGAGRIQNTDQFTLAIHQGTTATSPTVSSVTTAGTGTAITSGGSTSHTAAAATSYTVTEAASGTTNLAGYAKQITCTDGSGTQQGLPVNAQLDPAAGVTFTPGGGTAIACIITNSSANPTLVVTKALAGSGRLADTDQFTVRVAQGATVLSTGGQTTTTGAGTTVDAGTGTTGVLPVTAGTAYTLTELAAGTTDLAQYDTTVTCVDATGVQTGLPDGTPLDVSAGLTLTPLPSAQLSCVITNSTTAPTIVLNKQIAGAGRVNADDQFTVQILLDGTPINDQTAGTTAGSGSTVTGGTTGELSLTARTTYTLTEVGAGTTSLAPYQASITCTDGAGVQTGLPTTPVSFDPATGYSLTLAAKAALTCTITNTSTAPVIFVEKQSTHCDVGVPSCPLPGAGFALFSADPTLPGSTPISDGIVALSPDGPRFSSSALLFNTDYWLVETKAPRGFQLLAQPVRFSVSGSGVALANSPPAGSPTSITLRGQPADTLVITDLPQGPLPKAGGDGVGRYLVVALLMMLGAAAVHLGGRRGRIREEPS